MWYTPYCTLYTMYYILHTTCAAGSDPLDSPLSERSDDGHASELEVVESLPPCIPARMTFLVGARAHEFAKRRSKSDEVGFVGDFAATSLTTLG